VTPAALAALATAFRDGNRQAGGELVRALQPLVRSRIRARGGPSARDPVLFEDLEQQGAMGVLRAAQLWTPGRANVIGYATLWIDAYVLGFLRRSSVVHRSATDVRKRAPAVQMFDLDAPVGESDTHLDLLPSDEPGPDALAESAEGAREAKAAIARGLRCIPPGWRDVIRRRWLVEDPETLDEVGEALGLSRERIHQIEQAALKRMARSLGSPLKKPRTARVERRAA
jgi:RNA polymerase sigma-32 factor